MTTIIEELDIGLPLRTTYDLWTQFADFPSFMKKVETVEQESDEKTNWTAKVFWSRRTWEATIVEQVPDSHIVWRSTGAKGHVDGAVSFTELGPNLTRVLLVMEYWPKGLFEHTGNLWRAQGRRARLEFKHFRRHAMTNVILRQEDVEGWRGEIRDSEVVKTHEEALAEERAREEEPVPPRTEIARTDEPTASEPDEDADAHGDPRARGRGRERRGREDEDREDELARRTRRRGSATTRTSPTRTTATRRRRGRRDDDEVATSDEAEEDDSDEDDADEAAARRLATRPTTPTTPMTTTGEAGEPAPVKSGSRG